MRIRLNATLARTAFPLALAFLFGGCMSPAADATTDSSQTGNLAGQGERTTPTSGAMQQTNPCADYDSAQTRCVSGAREIYGTIHSDQGLPLAHQVVQVTTSDGELLSWDTTDDNGYFSTEVSPIGTQTLVLLGYSGATFEVFAANKATRYNLSLSKEGGGWSLIQQ